ncbi:MAG: FtsX-like permease family protein [Prevotellaceae bacterium]|jgi:ABC-type lipoprotein release transport system permease subunit|nr:FtsX-like permease family protein [Prevotellaceae bacterium]
MIFPVFIARRYLFAKKTHNVINVISYISVVGVAIGTLALVVILSIANGYDSLTKKLYSVFSPDIRISATAGKTFVPDSSMLAKIKNVKGVLDYSHVMEENVLISYRLNNDYVNRPATQTIAVMKGIDENYENVSGITRKRIDGSSEHSFVIMGEFNLWYSDVPQAIMGIGVAQTLGVNLNFMTPLEVWIPKRGTKVSISNPLDAMAVDRVYPSGIFSIEQTFDNNYFFVPIDFAQSILNYTNKEVSAIEIKIDSTANVSAVQKEIKAIAGDGFDVKNRYQQNETLYKMLSSEKYAIYAILVFIITLFSFNIIGLISMLIVDKKKDIDTLKILGSDNRTVKQIFYYQGCMIAIGGAIAGLVLGIILCLIQQYFKVIKLPNMFIIDAYPVEIHIGDIFLILAFVFVAGFAMARLPIWYLSKKMKW